MSTPRDLYDVLGVSPAATAVEIKRSYRKLALDSHPDRHPGDLAAEDRFKEISAAYAILGDASARVRYDRGRWSGESRRAAPPRPAVLRCRRCRVRVVSQAGDKCTSCVAEEAALQRAREYAYRARQHNLEGSYGHLGFYDRHGLPRHAIPTERSARRACGLRTWKVAWVP